MKRFCSMFVSAVMILACQCPVWAELSSKSKKAEKLITEGNIPGATEIYKELMAKDPVKNAALVKEGREGYAKMQLGLEKESLKYKRYDEVEKFVKEIITDYKETPSAKDAYQDMVTMRVGSGEKLFDDAKYDACMSLMNDTKKAVPADTEGLKGVTELSGKALLAAASAANKTKDNEKALAYIAMLNKLELTADSPLTAKSAELSASIGKELLAAAESDIASAKYDGALKNIELALTTSKDADFAAQAKYDTGLANRLNGQADKAAVSYQDVLDNHKASVFAPLAAYDLYLINLDKGSKTEALSDITAAADLKPENVDYQMIRAKLLSETGGQDEAKKIYTGLIDKLQGQIDKAYTGKEKLQYSLGEVYMKLESYPEAAIEFDHVNFEYRPGVRVLTDISFRVKSGERIAIVGPTGSGKTTITGLLLRLYDLLSGHAYVEGVEVRNWDPVLLRSRFAVVPQEPYLFPGTVATNIASQAEPDRKRVVEVLERIGALDLFMNRTGGLDAPVLRQGDGLSVGERQLVAFARALYRNAPFLILDEATASIDSDTEARLHRALETLLVDRTAIVVAHRLATIRHADRILVMQRGRLAEEGTHMQLVAQGGLYARLVALSSVREVA